MEKSKHQVKSAVITGFLGKTQDRFRSYNSEKSLAEKFSVLAEIDQIDGVEVVHPYEVPEASVLIDLLGKYKLSIAAINVNVKSEPEFFDGGLTSEDPAVRKKAVSMIQEAKDYAEAVGADKVQCCPLGDGYEFSFQSDYRRTWSYLKEGFSEAGAYKPEIPLFIEYKPNEVRGKCFLDSAAKTICLLEQIKNPSIGVTLDFGHSIYGKENPAEALSLLAGSGFPYYIHINDNDGSWDWDYMVGTKHFLEYVEFIYYLQEFGYCDYLTSDTSPCRLDIKATFAANARWTNTIWNMLLELDREELSALMVKRDYMKIWEFLEKNVFFRRNHHGV